MELDIKFDEKGLVPVIVQDYRSKEVLMLAYMNKEAIKLTLEKKIAHYYSRSRKQLWKKGETSGNIQYVKGLYYDCDADTILLKVKQIGVACHTNHMSCFFNEVIKCTESNDILEDLYALIKERKYHPIEDSYTTYLFEKGLDKILKKVGEESTEVIIAAKNQSFDEMKYEISDLVYHVLVLMINEGLELEDIEKELESRRKKSEKNN